MRSWLAKRLSGQAIQPDPDAKTSCLRPARSSTLREKLENGMLPAGSQLWSSSASQPVRPTHSVEPFALALSDCND